MWQIAFDHLSSELREILKEASRSMSVEQIIHQIYDRRDRLGDLMFASRDAERQVQRLRLEIILQLNAGIAEREVIEGETYYRLLESGSTPALKRTRIRKKWLRFTGLRLNVKTFVAALKRRIDG